MNTSVGEGVLSRSFYLNFAAIVIDGEALKLIFVGEYYPGPGVLQFWGWRFIIYFYPF